jgi:hypothetical protein
MRIMLVVGVGWTTTVMVGQTEEIGTVEVSIHSVSVTDTPCLIGARVGIRYGTTALVSYGRWWCKGDNTMTIEDDIKELVDEEFATFEDEECCVVFARPAGGGVLVYGPFVDDEEARTFVACGPHGLEGVLSTVQPLYPPHALHVEMLDVSDD